MTIYFRSSWLQFRYQISPRRRRKLGSGRRGSRKENWEIQWTRSRRLTLVSDPDITVTDTTTDCGLHWAPDYERQWPEPGSKSPDDYDFLKEKLDFSTYCICQLFTLFGKFWATRHMQFKNLIGSAHTCSESPSLTGKSIIMAETNKQASKRHFFLYCSCPYENGWWTGSWI